MPTIIDRGDGTFKYIADDNMGGGPEAIKRQTAEEYAFSQPARQELQERPNIYMTPRRGTSATLQGRPVLIPLDTRPEWMGNPATDLPFNSRGVYRPLLGNISVASPYQNPGMSQERILAHEYAHKTFDEDLPPAQQEEWVNRGRDYFRPGYYDRAARHYFGEPLTEKPVHPLEAYAMVAEDPATLAAMDPMMRGIWFPHLDNEVWDQRHREWASNWPEEYTKGPAGSTYREIMRDRAFADAEREYWRDSIPWRQGWNTYKEEPAPLIPQGWGRTPPQDLPYSPLNPEWRQAYFNPVPNAPR